MHCQNLEQCSSSVTWGSEKTAKKLSRETLIKVNKLYLFQCDRTKRMFFFPLHHPLCFFLLLFTFFSERCQHCSFYFHSLTLLVLPLHSLPNTPLLTRIRLQIPPETTKWMKKLFNNIPLSWASLHYRDLYSISCPHFSQNNYFASPLIFHSLHFKIRLISLENKQTKKKSKQKSSCWHKPMPIICRTILNWNL